MSAPAFLRNQFTDLYGPDMLPALEDLFRSKLPMHSSVRDQIFNEKSTSNGIYQSTSVHDMPLPAQVEEGEDYTFQRPRQGASKTLQTDKYGLGASISDEAIRFGKFDVVADTISKMAKSCKEGQEIAGMNIFNNGFSSSLVSTADGAALFSTAHTLPSGLTFANKLSTDADLSWSSLQEMRTKFEKNFIGDSGIIYNIRPSILLVPSEQRFYAQELLKSNLKPDSADNNINSMQDEGLRIIASPHLTDPDAWFMLSEKADHTLMVVKASGIETKSWEEPKNDSFIYKARYHEVLGVSEPYGVFGTTGAT